ncbi:MAG TPA: BrnA antitoxin family protein [Burkholderiaceae bacterium]|nr:BrnA antitoxin family protein [Burkholderiaceae bacterium]
MPTSSADKAITAAAKADPDAQPLTAKQLKAMVPMRTLRGRPKSENPKQLVSVRYSQEVLTYFKSTGEGWQSRMDGVLREYVVRQSRRAQR